MKPSPGGSASEVPWGVVTVTSTVPAGPAGVVKHFDELLRPLVDTLGFSVARIDLFCDVEGIAFSAEDRPGFVCRGSVCTTHEADRICTGFSFGSRRTQRISALIYD